jgi:hypothetical protein
MAGNVAQVNNFMLWLGIEGPEVRQELNRQGIRSLETLRIRKDKALADICKIMRRTPLPDPDDEGDLGNFMVGYEVETFLSEGAYYLRHLERISRPYTLTSAAQTQAAIGPMRELKEGEEIWVKRVEPDIPPKLTSAKAIRTLMEDLSEYFSQVIGRTGVPLQYVCRRDYNPPAPHEEEDYTLENDPMVAEMIRRAPLLGPAFIEDNRRVWHTIRATTFGTDAWGWVTQFERYTNGRAAYFALQLHFLGETHQSAIKTAAEKVINSSYYTGEKRNFTYEMYAAKHKQAHKDLADYGEVMTEDAKVRRFLDGLRAPSVMASIEAVHAAPNEIRLNFDNVVNFIARRAQSIADPVAASIIANMNTNSQAQGTKRKGKTFKKGDKKGKKGGGGGTEGENKGLGGVITNRYYTPLEWSKMTHAEREKKISLKGTFNARNISMVSNVEIGEGNNSNRVEGNVVAVATTGTQMSQRSHGPR